jgi:hypothetical protein
MLYLIFHGALNENKFDVLDIGAFSISLVNIRKVCLRINQNGLHFGMEGVAYSHNTVANMNQ